MGMWSGGCHSRLSSRTPAKTSVLRPGDVVAALYQPLSFTVMGATGRNEEVSFEGQGITLSQALGRIGGLQDYRADARGVFIFRFENPSALDAPAAGSLPLTPDGRVPVVYRVDLKDPNSFFVVQSFPIQDRDIIYVSNAPLAELQKFLGVLASLVVPAATARQASF